MDTKACCALGKLRLVRRTPATDNLMARDVWLTNFVLSEQCSELMQRIAAGIRGIARIVPNCDGERTLAIVFYDGTDPDLATELWLAAFNDATSCSNGQYECDSSFVPPNPFLEDVMVHDDLYSPPILN